MSEPDSSTNTNMWGSSIDISDKNRDLRCDAHRCQYLKYWHAGVFDVGLHHATSIDGVIDVHITSESVNGEIFCNFIERYLMPHSLPFDGYNPKSIVVLDNASIHHVEPAMKLLEETGALILFLPPYSPDLMPIEECFSKIESFLRDNDPYIQIIGESEIEDVILSAFASVTAEDCYGWMEHCGYI